MAVTTYSAEFPGARADAEAAAEPFGAEPWGAAPATADTDPPVVSNVSPVSGSTVAASATLSERVTDAQALKGVVILALFFDRHECVYDGRLVDGVWVGSFSPGYTSSTIAPATGGYDFGLVRSAGWYGSFAIRTRAHDGNSNE